jgi:hypothetical protein
LLVHEDEDLFEESSNCRALLFAEVGRGGVELAKKGAERSLADLAAGRGCSEEYQAAVGGMLTTTYEVLRLKTVCEPRHRARPKT